MSTQHTPGPWRVGDRKPYVEVWGPQRMNSSPILASMESEPREANARLMAAAPDILSALKEAVEFQNEDTECLVGCQRNEEFGNDHDEPCPDRRCHDHGCMVARVNRWRAAIAKAEKPAVNG